MSSFYIYFSGLLRKKVFWITPIVLLILISFPRALLVVAPGYAFTPLISAFCSVLSFVLSMLMLFLGAIGLFPIDEDIRKEVLFLRGFGAGLLSQFIMRVVMILLWGSFLFFMSSAVLWSFSINMLALMFLVASSLILFSCLRSFFSNELIYYLPVIIYPASLFYPLYVVPNSAYVLNSGLEDLFIYTSVYMAFYLLLSYKIFFHSWRRQCTL